MPRGIPNQDFEQWGWCLSGCSIPMILGSVALLSFINGAVWLSKTGVPPIVSAWNYLGSIWSWLPLIILGVLLITLFIVSKKSELALAILLIPFVILLLYLLISGTIIFFTEQFFFLM